MLQHPLYRRWVVANALAEMIGLGLTIGVFALVATRLGDGSPAVVLGGFALSVLAGILEATVVGLAQWAILRPWFPSISRTGWWLGTLGGALAAYVLGFLPSTIINLMQAGAPADAAPVSEPPQAVVLLLAAGMGLVAGAVLSFAQWLVLRRSVRRAARWIPANMLAWAAGMPVVFWTIDAAQAAPARWQMALIIAGGLLLTGAVVGAVHGILLVRFAKEAHSTAKTV